MADDEAPDVAGRGAESDADAEFTGEERDGVGEDSVKLTEAMAVKARALAMPRRA